jgi:long-chain acyl-CoA synthetase
VRIGSVGPPLPGVEVRIADDGEVLVRGGNVCAGYWSSEAATMALLDADGWMHTGDLGSLDADGWLSIIGRKKDLIITSSGQNVAPQVIETRLQAEPLIANVVVVGDGRPYLTALVTLDAHELSRWAHEHHKPFDPEALTDDPDVIAAVDDAIARVNDEHARIEGIKRFRILPQDLTMERGELTPTMKVKRAVVLDRYASLVAQMYGDLDAPA